MRVGELVGVYGTLKTGHGANSYLQGKSDFVTESRVSGELYGLGGFPGLKKVIEENEEGVVPFVSEGPCVQVELFRITDENLPRMLDGYEGYPNLYTRSRFATESGDIAWSYVYNRETEADRIIPSGKWE